MYWSVGILECISANPVRWFAPTWDRFFQSLALTESNLKILLKTDFFTIYFRGFWGFLWKLPHVIIWYLYTFSLFVFTSVKCIFCFSFPWIRKPADNKTCFFKNYVCRSLFSYSQLFLVFFLERLNIKFATTLNYTVVASWNYHVDYQTTQRGSRTTATSKMELFVTIVSFHSLTIVMKISILDVAGVLNPTFNTDIFAFNSWILINLKSIFPLYRNQSINSNGKKDGWLLWDRNILT